VNSGVPRAVVLAVDPGSAKCGLAVVGLDGETRELEVVQRDQLAQALADLVDEFEVRALLVGDRTGSRDVVAQIASLYPDLTVQTAPEHETTLRARDRYFKDHPPRGWRRLVPRGMLLPPRAVDDYAALVIAEDWLAHHTD